MLTSKLARVTAVALASTALATAIPPGTLTACETAELPHRGSASALPKNNNDDIFEEIYFAVPPAIPTAEGGHGVFRRSNDTVIPHSYCGNSIQ
ncbi:hypothetical protein M405DRAFT_528390 [Rhizopogon salebrosus TDB-379]|nr:hypothetical protein M405DRAFT_528390 [Rhizopogon salebrosus TDB-379]